LEEQILDLKKPTLLIANNGTAAPDIENLYHDVYHDQSFKLFSVILGNLLNTL